MFSLILTDVTVVNNQFIPNLFQHIPTYFSLNRCCTGFTPVLKVDSISCNFLINFSPQLLTGHV